MHEITVYTYGDSNSKATWSNVPFYLTDSFERIGFKVNRINMQPNHMIESAWNRIVLRVIRLVFPKSTYTFDRTPFFRIFARLKMKFTVKKYPQSEISISTSFSFHPGRYTSEPVVMFCDWTYQYYIAHFLHREPDILERQEIRNQQEMQKSVGLMVSLFPDVKEYIRIHESNKTVTYLGNVINSEKFNPSSTLISKKYSSNTCVFIGSPKYLPGLLSLLQAVKKLKNNPEIQIDVIGITEDKVPLELRGNNVAFYGYLNKSNGEENAQYYEIVDRAKLFVNTNPEWAAFSATLDVMYHATPVVTSHYRSFVETFGDDLNFGRYCENDPEQLADLISSIFQMNFTEYSEWCQNARKSVEPYTWANYVRKILAELNSRNLIAYKKL